MPWNKNNKSKCFQYLILSVSLLLWSLVWGLSTGVCLINNIAKINVLIETDCVVESVHIYHQKLFEHKPIGELDSGWKIKYTYEYQGLEYTSDQYNIIQDILINPGGITPEYSSGQQARCYVNPHKPSEAVLDIEWDAHTIFFDFLFIPSILFAVSMMLFYRFYCNFYY